MATVKLGGLEKVQKIHMWDESKVLTNDAKLCQMTCWTGSEIQDHLEGRSARALLIEKTIEASRARGLDLDSKNRPLQEISLSNPRA